MKIGLDIGGSHIAVGIINDNYEIILKEEKDIKISESENPNETLYNNLIKIIEYTISKVDKENLELIGLACPRQYRKWKNYRCWQLKGS